MRLYSSGTSSYAKLGGESKGRSEVICPKVETLSPGALELEETGRQTYSISIFKITKPIFWVVQN